MKRYILFLLCMTPLALVAQNYLDDLYFVPSEKEEKIEEDVAAEKRAVDNPTQTKSNGSVQLKTQDRTSYRDVDEYNRRYESSDYDFDISNDTLYVSDKENEELDGEWLNGGFNGSDSDYEYAERIIRFRNPRMAISVGSPLYYDVVYGINSWDWNIYDDGLYAYAFPTFTSPLWWDWRFNSYTFNLGWGWNRPYYGSWYSGYYAGLHDAYWGCHYPYYGSCYPHYGYNRPVYYNNRHNYLSSSRSDRGQVTHSTSRRQSYTSYQQPSRVQSGNTSRRSYSTSNGSSGTSRRNYSTSRGSSSANRRVVGTRTESSSRRNTVYTRPSSTRSTGANSGHSSGSTYRRNSSSSNSQNRSYRSGGSTTNMRRSSSYQSPRSSTSRNSSSYGSSSRRSYSSSSYSSGSSGSSTRHSSVGSSSMGSSHSSSRRR